MSVSVDFDGSMYMLSRGDMTDPAWANVDLAESDPETYKAAHNPEVISLSIRLVGYAERRLAVLALCARRVVAL